MRRLFLYALLILCAASCSAWAQEARVVERLPDGSLIVEFEAKQYRAITMAKVEELADQKAELNKLRQLVPILEDKAKLIEQKNALLEQKDQVSAQQIAALTELAKQLSQGPKRTKLENAINFLKDVGGLAFQLYLAKR